MEKKTPPYHQHYMETALRSDNDGEPDNGNEYSSSHYWISFRRGFVDSLLSGLEAVHEI